jgi:type II secretion system protein I
MKKAQGFTLIEALVALLVVAVAYTGVATAISQFVDQRRILVERHASHRIAWNRLMEQYLLSIAKPVDEPNFGDKSGDVTLNGGRWHWEIKEENAAADGLVRYQVDVYLDTGNQRAASSGSLSAFFTR